MITSKTNSKIKEIRKLLSSAKARNQQGVFVVEGERLVSEVPEDRLVQLFVSESNRCALPFNAEIVSDEVFKSLSDTVTPQGVLAVVKQPAYELSELLEEGGTISSGRNVIVLLDDLRDPGNLGTIIRTCEAAGVKGVILSPGCVDIFNPKVVRSTMGSIFRLPFMIAELTNVIPALQKEGYSVYGTSLRAADNYKDVAFGSRCAFVTGNEANGISEEVLTLTNANLIIPMKGKVESLNAAVSLAVLLFHVM